MHTGKGQVIELILEDRLRHARISCPANLVPSPGQYLLAGTAFQPDPLPVPLFSTESTPQGFTAPAPDSWMPGQEIFLRGPLGRGFTLPVSARKVALIAFDGKPSRLRGLIPLAMKQIASIALVCDGEVDHLPDEVEAQPLSALHEILDWADYAAFDAGRESLPGLRSVLMKRNQPPALKEAQVLIHAPVPCGGIAECGVCAVTLKSRWKLACKDGPVFELSEI